MNPEHVAAAALAGIPSMTPARLGRLLEHFGGPAEALRAVRDGRAGALLLEGLSPAPQAAVERAVSGWPEQVDVERVAHTLAARGTQVWLYDDDAYPITDAAPDRPAVLLAEGARPEVFAAPRVAIVGTRAATPHGLADAHDLGAHLARAGVTVVSGLAIGIDAAAHEGALREGGAVVGVVATGLDVEYPRRHRELYARVRASGVVLGETGFGIGPEARRFPVRNRIIALLADVVVVIEARKTGGARITAEHAARYGRPVFALPGSRRNVAAEGTNALIADGAIPLLDWSDVTLALGCTPGTRRCAPPRPLPSPEGRRVLDALGGEAASLDDVASRTRLEPRVVATVVRELESAGWVERARGFVWPR